MSLWQKWGKHQLASASNQESFNLHSCFWSWTCRCHCSLNPKLMFRTNPWWLNHKIDVDGICENDATFTFDSQSGKKSSKRSSIEIVEAIVEGSFLALLSTRCMNDEPTKEKLWHHGKPILGSIWLFKTIKSIVSQKGCIVGLLQLFCS